MVLAVLVPGCTRTDVVQHRFLAAPPATPDVARSASECIAGCRPHWSRSPSEYSSCLSGCPTIEVTENASCEGEEEAPFCFEITEEREVVDEGGTRVLFQVVGAAVSAVFDALGDGGAKSQAPEGKRIRKARSRLPVRGEPERKRQHL